MSAVHDGVAAVEFVHVVQVTKPLFCHFVSRVHDPAIGLLQN